MEQMRNDLKKLEEDVTQIRGILSEVHTAIPAKTQVEAVREGKAEAKVVPSK